MDRLLQTDDVQSLVQSRRLIKNFNVSRRNLGKLRWKFKFCPSFSAFVHLFRVSPFPSSVSARFFSFPRVSPLWRQFENTGVETVMRFSRSRGGVIIALGSTRAPSSSKHSSSSSSCFSSSFFFFVEESRLILK